MNTTKAENPVDFCPPNRAKVLGIQAGGHRYGENGRKMGMLDRGDGTVLKALQNPPRGIRELELYQTTFDPTCTDKDLLELRHFVPFFYGTEVIDDVKFLVMENLVHQFPHPNVLDLKMGRLTWDPEATPEKILQEESKYPPVKQLGFQLAGMMVYDPVKCAAEKFGSDYCRALTADNILTEGLGKFFGLYKPCGLRRDVVLEALAKLRRIEAWFLVQRRYAFYASSLLFIYSDSRDKGDDGDSSSALSAVPSPECCPLKKETRLSGTMVDEEKEKQNMAVSKDKYKSHANDHTVVDTVDLALENGTADKTSSSKDSRLEEVVVNGVRNHCTKRSADKQTGDLSVSEPNTQSGNSKTEEGAATKTKRASKQSDGGDDGSSSAVKKRKVEKLETGEGTVHPLVEVHMIDFAHAFSANSSQDDNYLFGLQRLISHLEKLLKM